MHRYSTCMLAAIVFGFLVGVIVMCLSLAATDVENSYSKQLEEGVVGIVEVEDVLRSLTTHIFTWAILRWLPAMNGPSDDLIAEFGSRNVAGFLHGSVSSIGKLTLPTQAVTIPNSRPAKPLGNNEGKLCEDDPDGVLALHELTCQDSCALRVSKLGVTVADLCPISCLTCCTDDPSNILAALDLTCASYPCSTNLHIMYPAIPEGTLVKDICQLHCGVCCGLRTPDTNASFVFQGAGFCKRSCNAPSIMKYNPVSLAQCKLYCLEEPRCKGVQHKDMECTLFLLNIVTGSLPKIDGVDVKCFSYGGGGTVADISADIITLPEGEPAELVLFVRDDHQVTGTRKTRNSTYEIGQINTDSSFIKGHCNYKAILELQHGGGICATDFNQHNPIEFIFWEGAATGFGLVYRPKGVFITYYSTWSVPRIVHPVYGTKGGALWAEISVKELFTDFNLIMSSWQDRLVVEMEMDKYAGRHLAYSTAGDVFRLIDGLYRTTHASETFDPLVRSFFLQYTDAGNISALWNGPSLPRGCHDPPQCFSRHAVSCENPALCPMSCSFPCSPNGTVTYYVKRKSLTIPSTAVTLWVTILKTDPYIHVNDARLHGAYLLFFILGNVLVIGSLAALLAMYYYLLVDLNSVVRMLVSYKNLDFSDACKQRFYLLGMCHIDVALHSLASQLADIFDFLPPQVRASIYDDVFLKKRSINTSSDSSSDELGLSGSSSESDVWASPRLNLSMSDTVGPPKLALLKKVNATLLVVNCSEFLKHLSRNLSKNTITSLHSKYLSTVFSSVKIHGGSPEYFWADRVTASFNTLRPITNHCMAGAKSSLDIVTSMKCVAGGDIHISVGLGTGQAVYGVMGADGIKTLTMIGKVNSIVNRMENLSYTFKLNVVTHDSVVQALMGAVDAKLFDAVKPTRSPTAVVVWELLSVRKNEEVENWLFQTDSRDDLAVYNQAMGKYIAGEYTAASAILAEQNHAILELLKQKLHVAMVEHPTQPPTPLTGPLWLRTDSQNGPLTSVKLDAGVATLRRDNEVLCNKADAHERLLMSLLPVPIIKQLQTGGTPPLEEYPAGSVLFADIVGFTERSARIPVRQVVQTLVELFGAFDALSESRGVTKIKTIGDCYMAATGVPVGSSTHADSCIGFALRVLGIVHAYNLDRTTDIAVRIGVHSGSVIGGVIGTRQFCFDLWGDTVNVAARMETASESNKVRLTAATYALLSQSTLADFATTEHHPVTVKGKGSMDTALVTPSNSILSDPTLRSYVSIKNNAQASEKFQALFLADFLGL